MIASASDDKTLILMVWDAKTGEQKNNLKGHTGGVNAVAWSPVDHSKIASASSDQSVIIWDAQTGGMVSQLSGGHAGGVNVVAYSRGGDLLASGGADGTVVVWSAASGSKLATLPHANSTGITSLSWGGGTTSSVGGLLACAGADGSTVVVWDSTTSAQLVQMPGGSAMVWSPRGDKLCTAAADGRVCLWDAAAGAGAAVRELRLAGEAAAVKVEWQPSGGGVELVAAAFADGRVSVWNGVT
jgi:WD40 repeat protein